MMPLLLAGVGEDNIIRKVGGNQETKKHLEDLGFVVGGTVTVVSEIAGNLIDGTTVRVENSLLYCEGRPILFCFDR